MTLEVVHRHEKLAPISGIKFMPMVPISGACVVDRRLLSLSMDILLIL